MKHVPLQARADEMAIKKIATWLIRAASRDGLTHKKILDSPLNQESLPREWNSVYSAAQLTELVCGCAKQLPDGDREIALTALNQLSSVTGATLVARFKSLSANDQAGIPVAGRRPTHWRRTGRLWSHIRPELAQRIHQELKRRIRTGWTEGTFAGADPDGQGIQPFIVDRLEVTYFFNQHRVFTHSLTERWLIAELSNAEGQPSVDHYDVRARYTDASNSEIAHETEILPILNCRRGATKVGQDGWLMTEMYFPEPLQDGEDVFFASLVRSEGEGPALPLVYIQVTSHGIVNLQMRLQFHPNATPRACWVYRGGQEPDRESAPSADEHDRWRKPTSLGYVEHVAQNCTPGFYYAVGWTWD